MITKVKPRVYCVLGVGLFAASICAADDKVEWVVFEGECVHSCADFENDDFVVAITSVGKPASGGGDWTEVPNTRVKDQKDSNGKWKVKTRINFNDRADGNDKGSVTIRTYAEKIIDAERVTCVGTTTVDFSGAALSYTGLQVEKALEDPLPPEQDQDGDGDFDNLDNCVDQANSDQANDDGDADGDVCDLCPLDSENDADLDNLCAEVDNCPQAFNPIQADQDSDGLGDACDACPGDANKDGIVDPLDAGFILSRFGCDLDSGEPECLAANQNGDFIVDPLDVGFVLSRFGLCPDPEGVCCTEGVCDETAQSFCDGVYRGDETDCDTLSCSLGDCCSANDAPGCDEPSCEQAVCAIDPPCCQEEWDAICAAEAATLCGACGGTGQTGDCCVINGVPGCLDEECEGQVCDLYPSCCTEAWDEVCAAEAVESCAVCMPMTTGACCTQDGGACKEENEADCNNSGGSYLGDGTSCDLDPCVQTDDCCIAHSTPGCEDHAVEKCVCIFSPSCCEVAWDPVCVELGIELGCASCPPPGDPPPNDECEGASVVECGLSYDTMITDYTLSADDPHSTCEIAKGGPFSKDASWWFVHNTAANQTSLTIDLCSSAGPNEDFDTVVTIFTADSACDSLVEQKCDDDACTLPVFGPSRVTTAVQPNRSYLILLEVYSPSLSNAVYTAEVECAP